MNLVFSGSNSTEIEFKVGIAGTASAPQRVAAVLEQDGVSLSFPAREEGGVWRAIVANVGQVFKEGLANFSINVILNDKIFVPMKNPVTIQTESPVTVDMTPAVQEVPDQPEVAVQIATAEQVEEEPKALEPAFDEPVAPKIEQKPAAIKQEDAPKPQVVAQKFSLLRSIEPVKKPVQEVKKVVQAKKTVTESVPKVTSFKLKRTKVVTE